MKKILKILALTIFLLITSSCINFAQEQDAFPYELMIGLNDLPENFEYKGSHFPEIDGAKAFYITYSRTSEELGALISHQIIIYSTNEAAKSSIAFWEKESFTNNWTTPKESTFTPSNSDDFYVLKCLSTQIDGRESEGCTAIQQHENLVILIVVNIDRKTMSFSEFDTVLKKLDARLPSQAVPTPQE